MRGMVYLGNRQVALRDFPVPEPGPGEAVVAIRASGLCGSDLGVYRGDREMPWIGGHEPCGEIMALGPGVTGHAVGDRVIVYLCWPFNPSMRSVSSLGPRAPGPNGG